MFGLLITHEGRAERLRNWRTALPTLGALARRMLVWLSASSVHVRVKRI